MELLLPIISYATYRHNINEIPSFLKIKLVTTHLVLFADRLANVRTVKSPCFEEQWQLDDQQL